MSFTAGVLLGAVVIGFRDIPFTLEPQQLYACFTPTQKCLPHIVYHVERAKQRIDVYVYSFTSRLLAAALLQAKERGVAVAIFADYSQKTDPHSCIKDLCAHIPVHYIKMPGLFHNKVMLIDQEVVIAGSYNFTNAAEYRNAENILFIRSKALAQQYEQHLPRQTPHTTSQEKAA